MRTNDMIAAVADKTGTTKKVAEEIVVESLPSRPDTHHP